MRRYFNTSTIPQKESTTTKLKSTSICTTKESLRFSSGTRTIQTSPSTDQVNSNDSSNNVNLRLLRTSPQSITSDENTVAGYFNRTVSLQSKNVPKSVSNVFDNSIDDDNVTNVSSLVSSISSFEDLTDTKKINNIVSNSTTDECTSRLDCDYSMTSIHPLSSSITPMSQEEIKTDTLLLPPSSLSQHDESSQLPDLLHAKTYNTLLTKRHSLDNVSHKIKPIKIHSSYKNTKWKTTTTTTTRKCLEYSNQPKKGKQLYLDFGQRDFAKTTVCPVCGMLYVHGVEDDAKRHAVACKQYTDGVTFHLSTSTTNSSSVARIVNEFSLNYKNSNNNNKNNVSKSTSHYSSIFSKTTKQKIVSGSNVATVEVRFLLLASGKTQ
jgi:zinc-finger of acetyl-transferase ESCO